MGKGNNRYATPTVKQTMARLNYQQQTKRAGVPCKHKHKK